MYKSGQVFVNLGQPRTNQQVARAGLKLGTIRFRVRPPDHSVMLPGYCAGISETMAVDSTDISLVQRSDKK